MQMCSAVFYCKIIFQEVAEGMEAQKEEVCVCGGGGKLHYLVAAAMGPNYSCAFLTVSPSLKTFLLELLTSLLTHCHTSCRTY